MRILQEGGLTDAEFVVAGDGEVDECRRRVSTLPYPERVHVPGWLSREDTLHTLERSWVFCLPSYAEGLPVALLEAMAYGLACVATPVGGIPEVLHDGATGLSVNPGDVSGLADALRRLIASRELCRMLGGAARDFVKDRYSVDTVTRSLVALYEDVISR